MERRAVLVMYLGSALWVVPGCAFVDPNAPESVPVDPCIRAAGDTQAGGALWFEVDGPSINVALDTDGNMLAGDFLVHFNGPAWTAESADCRANDMFFASTPTLAYAPYQPQLVDGQPRPPDSIIGYCQINLENPHEYTMYASAGDQGAGKAACEQTLTEAADVTAEWHNCPNGVLCPPASADGCFSSQGDGKAFGTFIDREDVSCHSNPLLEDHQDTILVTLGHAFSARFDLDIFGCLAHDPWSEGGIGHGRTAIRVTSAAESDQLGDFSRRGPDIDPTGALGYCLINGGARSQYAIFAMCDDPVAEARADGGAEDGGVSVPGQALDSVKQACADATRDPANNPISSFGHSTEAPAQWFDCPGGLLCQN